MEKPEAIQSTEYLAANCRRVVLANLQWVVSRCDLSGALPLVDTKVNIMTGKGFGRSGDRGTVYSPDIVYGWTQGRALESLAGHYAWLDRQKAAAPDVIPLAERTFLVLEAVTAALESLRAAVGGRLPFMLDAACRQPLAVGSDGTPYPCDPRTNTVGYTDIFYSKGLFAAARILGDETLAAAAAAYVRHTVDTVLAGRFVTDQQPMDPKNPVRPVPGRLMHGPYMISIGGMALMLAHTAEAEWWNLGCRLIDQILRKHVCGDRFAGLHPDDYLEFITPEGEPYRSDGHILADPGHALEFVGLTGRLLRAARETIPADDVRRQAAVWAPRLEGILARSFALGFNPGAGGIYKLVDLLTEKPVNPDMPWWSLPETLRAASLLKALFAGVDVDRVQRIQLAAWNALVPYLNPHQGLMAIQTRDRDGNPVDVIPGCPDADPCYHTGLSLIDVCDAETGAVLPLDDIRASRNRPEE